MVFSFSEAVLRGFVNKALRIVPSIDQKGFKKAIYAWYDALTDQEKKRAISEIGKDKTAEMARVMYKMFKSKEA
jgi:hypothetical protein